MEKKEIKEIFRDKNIFVYAKEVQVGEEADIADSFIIAAFIYANMFSKHLKNPDNFIKDFRKSIQEKELIDYKEPWKTEK